MKTFPLKIITPEGQYFFGEATFLRVKSSEFLLGIYPNHAPLITSLDISKMVIVTENETNDYAISGGVMHIKDDSSVVILTNSIESKDEIDLNRALEAKNRAEKRLRENDETISITRAKASLARAINRINIKDS